MPTNRNNNKYGSKNATPCRSSSLGNLITFEYVKFKHRHNITSRNIEHFDCEMNEMREREREREENTETEREEDEHMKISEYYQIKNIENEVHLVHKLNICGLNFSLRFI